MHLCLCSKKHPRQKNIYVRKHSTSVQISVQEFKYWFADVQNSSATSHFWCRCVSVFCTIFTAAIVAKYVSVRVSWFVIRRIGFVYLQWRIREGVTVVLCLWEREKNLHVCNFCLWPQIYWYTCVTLLYNYKFRCHRHSVVLHQIYLHTWVSCIVYFSYMPGRKLNIRATIKGMLTGLKRRWCS